MIEEVFSFFKKMEEHKIKKAVKNLCSIIAKYDKWEDVREETNLEAKRALEDYYRELRKSKINTIIYESGNKWSHTSYIQNLLRIRSAFEEKRYTRACNEILTITLTQPIFQGRIYYNLLKLLETYILNVENAGNADILILR